LKTDLSPPILLETGAEGVVLRLNRPAGLNRLTREMLARLETLVAELQAAPPRALIVTGAGGIFSAGADLGEVGALDPLAALEFARRGQRLLAALGACAGVTIAAIDGYCFGGGLDLALACDLRYATPRARFEHPGARRGILTGWGGTQRLPALVGMAVAHRILIEGARFDAEEARAAGLINDLAEDALARAREVARRAASRYSLAELSALRAGSLHWRFG
jgi:enoyl-CoA hydratase